MHILVSDTSVLIDIERASLTAHLFNLPYVFFVPDLLFERELAPYDGADLIARGLRIEELTGAEVTVATVLRRGHGALSLPDAFAFGLAQGRNWMLLTGDGLLRKLAIQARLQVHGALWLFDELETHEVCKVRELHAGLLTLKQHPRCRLPSKEIDARLQRYKKLEIRPR